MGFENNVLDGISSKEHIMNSDLNNLLRDFEKKILERDYHDGNPRKANKLFKEIHSIFKELKELNALERLKPLLDHENHSVVNFASKYYLLVDEKEAIKRLESLAKLGGIEGFAAENLIDRWKKGDLSFEY